MSNGKLSFFFYENPMNGVHGQCPRTVTLNSALSQNWVGCTVRMHCAQVACTLRTVVHAASLSHAHMRSVAHALHAAALALVATQKPKSRSRTNLTAQGPIATLKTRSQLNCPNPCPGQVATSKPCRDSQTANQVSTPISGHDLAPFEPCQDTKAVSRPQTLKLGRNTKDCVATPLQHTMGLSSRDTRYHVTTP